MTVNLFKESTAAARRLGHDLRGVIAELEASLYDRRFLLARPLLQALEDSPAVLLVDEVDRSDDEFEAISAHLHDCPACVARMGELPSATSAMGPTSA